MCSWFMLSDTYILLEMQCLKNESRLMKDMYILIQFELLVRKALLASTFFSFSTLFFMG